MPLIVHYPTAGRIRRQAEANTLGSGASQIDELRIFARKSLANILEGFLPTDCFDTALDKCTALRRIASIRSFDV